MYAPLIPGRYHRANAQHAAKEHVAQREFLSGSRAGRSPSRRTPPPTPGPGPPPAKSWPCSRTLHITGHQPGRGQNHAEERGQRQPTRLCLAQEQVVHHTTQAAPRPGRCPRPAPPKIAGRCGWPPPAIFFCSRIRSKNFHIDMADRRDQPLVDAQESSATVPPETPGITSAVPMASPRSTFAPHRPISESSIPMRGARSHSAGGCLGVGGDSYGFSGCSLFMGEVDE